MMKEEESTVDVQLDDYLPFSVSASLRTTVGFMPMSAQACCVAYGEHPLWVKVAPTEEDHMYCFCWHGKWCELSLQLGDSLGDWLDGVRLVVQTAAKYTHDCVVVRPREWPLESAAMFHQVLMEEMPGIVSKCLFAESGADFQRAFEVAADEAAQEMDEDVDDDEFMLEQD